MSDDQSGLPRLADQLNLLFATVPRSDEQGLWTNEDAAAAMTAAGVTMSPGYLSLLRTGRRTNPSARHLGAIARLFGVPTDFFLNPDTAEKIEADLRLLTAIRDAGVQDIALHVQELSAEGRAGVADMIALIHRLERGRGRGGSARPR